MEVLDELWLGAGVVRGKSKMWRGLNADWEGLRLRLQWQQP
jgi:hypothetical protein